MPLEALLALAVFAFVTSVTPGPNNLMLLASGVNFGLRRTIPHMLGIGVGFGVLLLCVGYGLGQMLTLFPVAFTALKLAGGAYLVYLAWRIAMSGEVGEAAAGARPITLIEAAAFQWVNPKGWVMAVGAVYTDPDRYVASVMLVAGVFVAIGVAAISLWAAMGIGLRRFLDRPAVLRMFNWTMALLLVASLWPMLR
ncbi:MAG: lysine transporter LysE [Alphaproteobacteria bacterium]|nr:MAG: lysine transporter LysE [Alphaproteobacteria bacterium]